MTATLRAIRVVAVNLHRTTLEAMEVTAAQPISFDARYATVDDVDEVVRLRTVMFDAMGVCTDAPGWSESCAHHLRAAIDDGTVVAAVVDAPVEGGLLAAAGLIQFQQRIPSPTNPTGQRGYVGSMSTDPRWRRLGLARRVLILLVDAATSRAVDHLELHATDEGVDLYRSFGFTPRQRGIEMTLHRHRARRPPSTDG